MAVQGEDTLPRFARGDALLRLFLGLRDEHQDEGIGLIGPGKGGQRGLRVLSVQRDVAVKISNCRRLTRELFGFGDQRSQLFQEWRRRLAFPGGDTRLRVQPAKLPQRELRTGRLRLPAGLLVPGLVLSLRASVVAGLEQQTSERVRGFCGIGMTPRSGVPIEDLLVGLGRIDRPFLENPRNGQRHQRRALAILGRQLDRASQVRACVVKSPDEIERNARREMRLEQIGVDRQCALVQGERVGLPARGVETAALLHQNERVRCLLRRQAGAREKENDRDETPAGHHDSTVNQDPGSARYCDDPVC